MKTGLLIAASLLALHQSAPAQQRLSIGSSASGQLGPTDTQLPGGRVGDVFLFSGVAGQRVAIELSAAGLDAVLILEGPNGFRREHARKGTSLQAVLPSTGEYRVTIASSRAGAQGSYQVAVRALGPNRTRSLSSFANVAGSVAGRAYLSAGEDFVPADGELPNGLILLRKGDDAVNQSICQSFVDYVAAEEDLLAADAEAKVISTYWPLAKIPGSLTNCEALLKNYDYARSLSIRSKYGLANAQGPVFLAVGNATEYFALDLSRADAARAAEVTKSWFSVAMSEGEAGTLGGEETSATPAEAPAVAQQEAAPPAADPSPAPAGESSPATADAEPFAEEPASPAAEARTSLTGQQTSDAPSVLPGQAKRGRAGKGKGKQLFAMACKLSGMLGVAVPMVGTVSQAVCPK